MKAKWILEVLGGVASLSAAAVIRDGSTSEEQVQRSRPRSSMDVLTATPHYVPMRAVPRSTSLRQRRALSNRDTPTAHPFNAGLTNIQDIYYVADIMVGNQTLPVCIDTGSSDTWFIKSPFVCLDYYNNIVPVSPFPACFFSFLLIHQTHLLHPPPPRNPNAASARASPALSAKG